MDATQAEFSTSALPPTGLEVSLNPQLTPALSPYSSPRGSRRPLAFQPVVITNTNERSVNQRLPCGQEDGFVSAASITEQPVFVESKDERVSEEL